MGPEIVGPDERFRKQYLAQSLSARRFNGVKVEIQAYRRRKQKSSLRSPESSDESDDGVRNDRFDKRGIVCGENASQRKKN